jgi:hypothetical protein
MRPKFDEGWGRSPREMLRYLSGEKINQYDGQLIRVIEFFTIGYSKYSDEISISQFVEMSKIDKRHVNERLENMEKRGLIGVEKILKKGTEKVRGSRYRILFDVKPFVTSTGDYEKIKVTWSGKKFTSTGDKSHPHRSESHPQRNPPKKSLLRLFKNSSPKKEEVVSQPVRKKKEKILRNRRLTDEEIQDQIKKARDIEKSRGL